jgi:hypothetical protein
MGDSVRTVGEDIPDNKIERKMTNYFNELNSVDCSAKIEKKNGLTYLSWAWAWAEVKKRFPEANYTIYENKDGWNYFTDGRTCWVKTGVTIADIQHIEFLPVMDNRNNSIPLEKVTSFDVNKAIQRSLTKACARHGLGLYIYAGEDLPENVEDDLPEGPKPQKKEPSAAVKARRTAAKRSETPLESKNSPEAAQSYQPMDADAYWGIVRAYGQGRKTKSGGDYRDAWIKHTHATPEAIAQFDKDVQDYLDTQNGNI